MTTKFESVMERALAAIERDAVGRVRKELLDHLDGFTLVGDESYNKGWEDCKRRVREFERGY